VGLPEKVGVMTPEIWRELCRINAVPPDQREAAFLEAAPRLGVKPGTVVPRWHWDFQEYYKRMLEEMRDRPISAAAARYFIGAHNRKVRPEPKKQ